MKEIKLYFSDKCPDCPPIIKNLDELNIEYEKINITNSMPELKEFLAFRDNDKFFTIIKEETRVGVPSLLIDGKFYNPYEIDLNDLKK